MIHWGVNHKLRLNVRRKSDEMIDELAGWRFDRSGTVLEFFGLGSVTMELLIVASTLALFYGRTVCSLVAWLLSRGEEMAKKSDVKKKVVDSPVRGLEDAGGRRWARAEFYRMHPNFDHNCPSVRALRPHVLQAGFESVGSLVSCLI